MPRRILHFAEIAALPRRAEKNVARGYGFPKCRSALGLVERHFRAASRSLKPLFISSSRPATHWLVGDITRVLREMDAGDARAPDRLLAIVYDELRQLAAAKMARERPGHTLQATALVHEAWLRLGGDSQPAWQNRRHFFAAAAEAMRRVLIERARRKLAARRGAAVEHLELDAADIEIAVSMPDEDLLHAHDALERLALEDPRKAELVKLRYFVGLSLEEAAQVLGISARTAKRDWAYARAWLGSEIESMRIE